MKKIISDKRGQEFTIGKLLAIVLGVVLLALIIWGVSTNAFAPLTEKVSGFFNYVLGVINPKPVEQIEIGLLKKVQIFGKDYYLILNDGYGRCKFNESLVDRDDYTLGVFGFNFLNNKTERWNEETKSWSDVEFILGIKAPIMDPKLLEFYKALVFEKNNMKMIFEGNDYDSRFRRYGAFITYDGEQYYYGRGARDEIWGIAMIKFDKNNKETRYTQEEIRKMDKGNITRRIAEALYNRFSPVSNSNSWNKINVGGKDYFVYVAPIRKYSEDRVTGAKFDEDTVILFVHVKEGIGPDGTQKIKAFGIDDVEQAYISYEDSMSSAYESSQFSQISDSFRVLKEIQDREELKKVLPEIKKVLDEECR